jgi:RimJ/RimL family protein N-acetyltransferase
MIVYGRNINMRTVELKDAEFIHTMRQDEAKTKYLSKVNGTIESQKEWIKNYKQREEAKEEFYFVIESKKEEKLGLIRMYAFKDDAPKTTAIESALQIYEFGFYELGFEKSHFDVRKGNDKVIAFHQRFGAKIADEDELDYYFNYEKNDYEITKEKYRRYL